MRALVKLTRFVIGVAAVTAVLVGIPLMLMKIAGWPLPTYLPAPADVVTAVQQRNIPSTFVVKALAVVLWLLWVQFAWASLWELAVNLRRLGRHRETVPAPLVPARMQRGAARFIASLFTATVVTGSSMSSLAGAVSAPVGVSIPVAVGLASQAALHPASWDPHTVEASQALPTWRASKEDSLWSISQSSLGDGSRVGEILELNPTLTSARSLRSGMVLRLPIGATVPADRATPSPIDIVSDTYLPSSTVTIVPGDTLWDLSEDRIELAIDGDASPRQTLEYLHVVIDKNPDVIEDPNLIFPGEQFVLPSIGEPPALVDEHDSRPPSTDPSAPAVHAEPVTAPSTTADAEQVPTSAPPALSVAETTVVAPADDAAPQDHRSGQVSSHSSSSQSLIAKLGVSTVLAGGVLALVRRKRIRRGARDHSQLKMLGRLDQVEGLLARRANLTMHQMAQALLFEAAAYVAREGLGGAPVAIEISADDGIELLWDEQNHTCTRPWKVIDHGWSWAAPLHDEVDLPAEGVEAAAAALVTLGTRDGRTLMLDLEAFGAVTVAGDIRVAEDLVRSIALELATGEVMSNAYVSLVGFELGGIEHLPRVTQRTEVEAIRHLKGITRANGHALADGAQPTLFHLRGAAPDGREATVMIVRAAECSHLEQLLEHAKRRQGVAVVVLSQEAVTETEIFVDADGSGIVRDLGLDFTAAGVSAAAVDEIEVVVEAIDDVGDDGEGIAAAFELVEPEHISGAPAEPTTQDQVEHPTVIESAVQLELIASDEQRSVDEDNVSPDLFVRLIGKPRIDGVAGLSSLATSIVAYIATRGGDVPTDEVMEAVWNGSAIERKTLNNHLSTIRARLGDRLPPISKSTGTLRLDGYVLTDLQLLAQLYEQARSASSGEAMLLLRQGLDLVGGTPFNDSNFGWSQMGQHRAEADGLIERVALALVALALEAGDHDVARAAIISGLRAVPMSEPLYRARMNVEAGSGDLHAVKKAYAELTCLLDNMIAGFEPSDDTTALFVHLTNRPESA